MNKGDNDESLHASHPGVGRGQPDPGRRVRPAGPCGPVRRTPTAGPQPEADCPCSAGPSGPVRRTRAARRAFGPGSAEPPTPDPADGLSALQRDPTDRRGLVADLPVEPVQCLAESVLVSAVQPQLPLPARRGLPVQPLSGAPTLPGAVPLGRRRLRWSVRATGNATRPASLPQAGTRALWLGDRPHGFTPASRGSPGGAPR